jgi:RarD protein
MWYSEMKGKLKIIIAMLIFGSIGLFVRTITMSSNEIALLRAIIGSVFLGITGFLLKQKPSFRQIKENLIILLLSGSAIGFNWILLFQAYKYTTISNATLSYYFAPVFVIIMSPIILKEKLNFRKTLCVTLSMIGLFLILNLNGGYNQNSYNHLKGIAFGLSAALLYSAVIILNKFIKNLSGFETTLIQLFLAALVLLPTIALQGNINLGSISASQWILILILGIIHTGIAYYLYFTSIRELEGQAVAIISYIDPISAVFFSVIFLSEAVTMRQLIGGILILGSTFFSEKK